MPVSSFVPAVQFVWPAPSSSEPTPAKPVSSFIPAPPGFTWPPLPAEVPAPAPPTDAERRTAAAVRLGRAFRRVQRANPSGWRLSVPANEVQLLRKYTGAPCGPIAHWRVFAGRVLIDHPHVFYGTTTADVPALPRLQAALRLCWRLVKRSDPTEPRAAVFGRLVESILAEQWAASEFVPGDDGAHHIAVSYPSELLAMLRQWAGAQMPRVGRTPDPKRREWATLAHELKAEGVLWKEMPRRIEAEFSVTLRPESIRKLCRRYPRTKCGTE